MKGEREREERGTIKAERVVGMKGAVKLDKLRLGTACVSNACRVNRARVFQLFKPSKSWLFFRRIFAIPSHSYLCRLPKSVPLPLLFRIDKSSLGVSRILVSTPRDDCPYAKSNDNPFVRAHAYRVFLTWCVGINRGDIPRGLRHPRDVASVDPSTLGRKTLNRFAR